MAANGVVDLQAQAGAAQVAARQTLEMKTVNGAVQIAARQRVYIATAGGAYIQISEGRIEVGCPGKITVKAGTKSMVGPATQSWPMPALPRSTFKFEPGKPFPFSA